MNGVWLAAVAAALTSTAALGLGWSIHTRLRGIFPDDRPHRSGRKAHGRPVAMAGLVPAGLTVGAAATVGQWRLAAAVALAAAAGFADDLGKSRDPGDDAPPPDPVPWWCKGLALVGAASLVAPDAPAAIGWPTALVFVAVLPNAVNFLDNMNGVATVLGVVGLAGATASLAAGATDPGAEAAWFGASCIGIWLGFLPWNWPRARMFLGDAGAYALGLTLAALSLSAAERAADSPTSIAAAPWLALTLPALVPLADFVQVVLSRLVIGVAPWIGDRRHLSHLLHLHLHVPRPAVAPTLAAVAAVAAVVLLLA